MDYSEDIRKDLRLMCHFMMRSMFMGTRNYAVQLEDIADFFFPQERVNVIPPYFRRVPSYNGPDCCGICRTFFGRIRGGRITEGCHLCQDTIGSRVFDDYYNDRIARHLGISPQWIELSMAEAFNEHTTYLLSSKSKAAESFVSATFASMPTEIQTPETNTRNQSN